MIPTVAVLHAQSRSDPNEKFPPKPAIKPQTASQALKSFKVESGYGLELVLAEPMVKEPVAIAFDGDGRMFVAEMSTYMQDIDGTGELEPRSRVTLHASSAGDGVYDKHTIFADNLLLPRMILPLAKGQLVINETNSNDLYLHTDTDGDGKADKKELWFGGGPRGGNLEHQPSGLLWALDNAIYTTYNDYRLRWTPNGVVEETVSPTNGQWGLGQSNDGHIYYVNASGEQGPLNFQESTVYGDFNAGQQFAKGYKEVFPLVGVGDVQGGHNRHRADGTLNNLTACAGIEVYRGDAYPELVGNLFFGEPVGRMVRRSVVTTVGGLIQLGNPHQEQKSEFIRSNDLAFRPINLATAPDGTLFIVDMYRGIIQEGAWVNKGSYLRQVVEQYSMDKLIGRGRIWRVTKAGMKKSRLPRMYSETPAQWVAHLAHPNGWWRDTAQRLLILKQDKGAVPALTAMAQTDKNPLARVHALWTLEGLGALTPEIIAGKLEDEAPEVRVSAIRASERLLKSGSADGLKEKILAKKDDRDPGVAKQVFLTGKLLEWPEWRDVAQAATKSEVEGIRTIANLALRPPRRVEAGRAASKEQREMLATGMQVFATLCATCHGEDGRGTPLAGAPAGTLMAPPFAGSDLVAGPAEGPIAVLLHGLTGDIDGKKYEGIMVPMGSNDDKWIAGVVSYIRGSFGNKAGMVSPEDVAKVREMTKARTSPYTIDELRAIVPPYLPRSGWKVSSSHNSGATASAIDDSKDTRWDSSAFQQPGIWFQVELPEPKEIAGILLDASGSANDYPRGYEVTVSTDGKRWSKPIATGKPQGAITEIAFEPVKTKYVRITDTGSAGGNYWSIHEIQLLRPVKGK